MVIKELKKKTERPKCDDCVSRADVLKYKCDCYDAQNHLLYAVPTGHIMRLPSVTPERKMGKWKTALLDHEAFGVRPKVLYCSECNQCIAYPTRYCPNCGADMRGEQGDND